MNIKQTNFAGGINTIMADTQIPQGGYFWLINGRNRFGPIEPVKKHRKIATLPVGHLQGLLTVGNVTLVFVAGNAYAKLFNQDVFQQIVGFSLDSKVERFWACAVPASTLNFQRNLDTSVVGGAGIKLSTSTITQGTPSCIVVQDGINTPSLIYDDGNGNLLSRKTLLFNPNSIINEYIPVGKQMMYLDGILYVVEPNRKFCYRSITGKPLNFCINVDVNGKSPAAEKDANVTFAFDYQEITCLTPSTIPSSFVYGTKYNTRVITEDFNNTIFDEPTFYVSSIINSGLVNQNSSVDILGDLAIVNGKSIAAFDAIKQLRFNGQNSIFSLEVSKYLEGIEQDESIICWSYDNYAFFNVETTMGNAVLVYDILKDIWVGMDITEVIYIKDIAVVDFQGTTQLFCITYGDEMYQMYCGTETYPVSLMSKAFAPDDTNTEHKTQKFRAFFNDSIADGFATVTEYVDGKRGQIVKQPLNTSTGGIRYPVRAPVRQDTNSRVDNPAYNMSKGMVGKKLQFCIQWDSVAKLVEFQLISSEVTNDNQQKNKNLISTSTYGS